MKETLDKVVGQLDLITRTLGVMEQRVTKFENHLLLLSSRIPQNEFK